MKMFLNDDIHGSQLVIKQKMFSWNDTEITCFMDESSYIRHTISMISAEFSNLMTV
jgi:hypothetical protein